MNILRRDIMIAFALATALTVAAQGPNDSGTYYQSADGLTASSLKTALCAIIYPHTERAYSDLWEDFKSTDMRADGYVWDMYSGTTNYVFGDDQASGSAITAEGDCYNREHSFPKSWFGGEVMPMYTDLMHLLPTDGYVNAKRGNYPFGEVATASYSSEGDFSRLGTSAISGYSGTVFEPNDEYKGDFARIYFYMVTAYEEQLSTWSCDMLSGDTYPALADWVVTMLLDWAYNDPVSDKETARNEAVYAIQGNRNPFVDYPGLEQYVWGPKMDTVFSYDDYDATLIDPGTDDGDTDTDGGDTDTDTDGDGNTDGGTTGDSTTDDGQLIYYKVAAQSDIETDGCTYLIVYEGSDGSGYAMAATSSDVRGYAAVTIDEGTIVTSVSGDYMPHSLVIGGEEGAYTLYDSAEEVYLALTSNKNKLNSSATADDDYSQWSITISDGTASIYNNAYPSRLIQYNPSSPRFACYTGTQQDVALYKNVTETATGIASVSDGATTGTATVSVYSISGVLVRSDAARTAALVGLPKGVYIVEGRKVVVR